MTNFSFEQVLYALKAKIDNFPTNTAEQKVSI
jgi:hypothetical protein